MKVYTKKGDNGMTSLLDGTWVSKSDERMDLIGTVDELNSHIGLAKVAADDAVKEKLEIVQRELMTVMSGVAAHRDRRYKITEEQVSRLEQEIDAMEDTFPREKGFVLYGGCELSARLDVARAVARRAERMFRKVQLRYGADPLAMRYVNRLSDYLYILARCADHQSRQNDKQVEDIIRQVMKHMDL